jgi:hypothetical protein
MALRPRPALAKKAAGLNVLVKSESVNVASLRLAFPLEMGTETPASDYPKQSLVYFSMVFVDSLYRFIQVGPSPG